jgi:hypothetical protein
MHGAIDAGLERVAAAGAEPVGQAPIETAAGKPEADDRVRREVIIHAGGKAVSLRADIGRAGGRIAIGAVAAAERRAPRRPPLTECRLRRRLGEDRGVSQRDVRRQIVPLLRREADGTAAVCAEAACPAVDERIEHQAEELRHDLQSAAFGAGRRLAVQLRQCVEERRTGEVAEALELRRQWRIRSTVEDAVIDDVDHTLLVYGVVSKAKPETSRSTPPGFLA